MGPGRNATEEQQRLAYTMGAYTAKKNHILLTGGVAHGVMHAASKGAAENNGFVVGILPYEADSSSHPVSEYVNFFIPTNFGEGRNVLNAKASTVLIIIGMCWGTLIEVGHGGKNQKPLILLDCWDESRKLIEKIKGNSSNLFVPTSIEATKEVIDDLLERY